MGLFFFGSEAFKFYFVIYMNATLFAKSSASLFCHMVTGLETGIAFQDCRVRTVCNKIFVKNLE